MAMLLPLSKVWFNVVVVRPSDVEWLHTSQTTRENGKSQGMSAVLSFSEESMRIGEMRKIWNRSLLKGNRVGKGGRGRRGGEGGGGQRNND